MSTMQHRQCLIPIPHSGHYWFPVDEIAPQVLEVGNVIAMCYGVARPSEKPLAGWHTCHDPDDPSHVHVHPIGDHIEHSLDDDGTCVCGPRIERHTADDGGDGWVIVHHSLDGREQHEP